MRLDACTLWVPNPSKVGIDAPLGWSVSIGHVVRYRDAFQAMGLTLKEGET